MEWYKLYVESVSRALSTKAWMDVMIQIMCELPESVSLALSTKAWMDAPAAE